MPELAGDLTFRGLVHQVTDPSLPAALDHGQLTAYIGFDPTADSLHVGNLLQLCTLRRLQQAGHRPIAVAGGGTGVIGDPGGKSEERSLLSDDQIRANLQGIRPQLERFLDFGGGDATAAVLVDNGDWLRPLRLVDFLRDVGKHFTVNQMVTKESVRARLERPEHGISYTEFSYMLLQAYDFLHLFDHFGCRLQLGGSDQWGNITMGIDLIRRTRGGEAFGLTSPLVLKADGTKFGKTESGTVWLAADRTSPYQLYQFFLRTEDAVVGAYVRYFTFLGHDEIVALDHETATRPERRAAQRALARSVCALVHGDAEADGAARAAEALFSGALAALDERAFLAVSAEAPSTSLAPGRLGGDGMALVDALVETGLAVSRTRARSLVSAGGVSVNDERVGDPDRMLVGDDLRFDRFVVLRKGKRDYHLLVVEDGRRRGDPAGGNR